MNGVVPNEGRVEICFDNLWGSICDDLWGRQEAKTVCRQLGYVSTIDSIPLGDAFFGHSLAAIHLDNLECGDNETALVDCLHNGVGSHNCIVNEDAGVVCDGAHMCFILTLFINLPSTYPLLLTLSSLPSSPPYTFINTPFHSHPPSPPLPSPPPYTFIIVPSTLPPTSSLPSVPFSSPPRPLPCSCQRCYLQHWRSAAG